MEIISPVFRMGSTIPVQYSCRGQNVNPPLTFFNVPKAAQSLALIMHDPDAPGKDYLHWLVWDILPSTDSISVNGLPVGAMQGTNDSGKVGYSGPCPPVGKLHTYIFDVYALNTTLDLPSGSHFDAVMNAMQNHILEHSDLKGTFSID